MSTKFEFFYTKDTKAMMAEFTTSQGQFYDMYDCIFDTLANMGGTSLAQLRDQKVPFQDRTIIAEMMGMPNSNKKNIEKAMALGYIDISPEALDTIKLVVQPPTPKTVIEKALLTKQSKTIISFQPFTLKALEVMYQINYFIYEHLGIEAKQESFETFLQLKVDEYFRSSIFQYNQKMFVKDKAAGLKERDAEKAAVAKDDAAAKAAAAADAGLVRDADGVGTVAKTIEEVKKIKEDLSEMQKEK